MLDELTRRETVRVLVPKFIAMAHVNATNPVIAR